ncbi:hypothetical protein STEG23_020333, partial [Scotinomys teguina]
MNELEKLKMEHKQAILDLHKLSKENNEALKRGNVVATMNFNKRYPGDQEHGLGL